MSEENKNDHLLKLLPNSDLLFYIFTFSNKESYYSFFSTCKFLYLSTFKMPTYRQFLSCKDDKDCAFKSNGEVNELRYIYYFNNKYSIKYYLSEDFRNEVKNRIDTMYISLNLTRYYDISNFNILKNLHTLILRYCHDITDVSSLENINTLNLHR